MRPPLPNRALLTLAAVGCISVAAMLFLEEPPHERLAVHGDSSVVSMEDGGRKLASNRVKALRFVFSRNQITMRITEQVIHRCLVGSCGDPLRY